MFVALTNSCHLDTSLYLKSSTILSIKVFLLFCLVFNIFMVDILARLLSFVCNFDFFIVCEFIERFVFFINLIFFYVTNIKFNPELYKTAWNAEPYISINGGFRIHFLNKLFLYLTAFLKIQHMHLCTKSKNSFLFYLKQMSAKAYLCLLLFKITYFAR